MSLNNSFDIITIISSYNRYDMLDKLIADLLNSSEKYTIKIIINDDGSSDERYKDLKNKYKTITLLRSENNNGKNGYWLSINTLLQEAKEFDYTYLLTIPDDFEICDNFINLIINEHENSKKIDNKIICTTYATIRKDQRWELKYWMDGDGIFDKLFFDSINYNVDKIKPTGKNQGSGVWKQLSQKINNMGYKVHKPKNTYINHLGYSDSKMHPELRKIKNLVIKKTI